MDGQKVNSTNCATRAQQ